ncbi:MAG: diguanylate cyclase (GGDEF)-like protein [Desulforhopalus sp.]|jgi:diguanylate cyclase (GGDEF)-like protein
MNHSSQKTFISNVSFLKQKASKHSINGVLIACATIVIATVLSGFTVTGQIGVEAFIKAQKTNSVLWFLDAMPFIFAIWGQYMSSLLSYEAGAMIIDQTSDLRRQSIVLEQKAAHDATHDSLTGLPNRTLFIDRLQQAANGAKRDDTIIGILTLDINRFKEVNDSLGHYNGDRLLKQIAIRLSSMVRDSDTFARTGGDEFGFILPNAISEDGIGRIVKKINQSLAIPFILENLSIEVQVSIGASTFPKHGIDADTLIQKADIAMYVAKQNNAGFALYSKDYDQQHPHRLTLMGELRRAIQNDELLMSYQPKIVSATGKLHAVEALIRWNHPQHDLMPPDDFIPLAERTGLIDDLTVWVLKKSLKQCAIWHKAGNTIGMAVNVSSLCLLNPDFPETLTGLLAAYQLPTDLLILEITETSMMVEPDRALSILNRIHQQGVKISIDDFGTGYSSLAYLKKLPVSELKIDKSFVLDMLTNESDATIVNATIQLGHNLGLQVVAEGVEDQKTLDRLRAMGCDLQQGYFISHPVSADDLTAWAIRHKHFKE